MARRRRQTRKKKSFRRACAGLNKRTGKLKKGYTWRAGGPCPRKVA